MSELRTQRVKKARKPCSFRKLSPLTYKSQRLQHVQSLAERLALLGQGNLLLHGGPNPEELTNLIKCTAKASCCHETSKATHGIVSLFDASVILFQVVV